MTFDAPLASPAAPNASGAAPGAIWPLLAAVLAAASFVGMDTAIKLMSSRYDAFQLSFFRFASGSVFAVALWLQRRPPLPERAAWKVHGASSVLLLISLVGYFHALTELPLAQTVAISYLSPIFVSVLAIPLLGERPSSAVWLALALGLAGVLMSMLPALRESLAGIGSERLLGVVAAAVAALSYAAVMLIARRQARRDALLSILLIQNLLPALLLVAPAAWTWKPFAPADLLPIVLAGALATVGLLSMTFAFSRLEASRVAPLEYSSFIWAAGLGFVFFGEVPTLATATSALLIFGGCVCLLRR